MSEVNLTFVVDEYNTTFTVETTQIEFVPEVTELAIYTGGYATAAGSSGEVQFNSGGILAGNSQMTYDPGPGRMFINNINSSQTILGNNIGAANVTTTALTVINLATLGNVANIRIAGGTNGQVLKTFGNGVVAFSNTVPGGSNTQIQYNNDGELSGIGSATFAAGKFTLGPVGNVKINGGTNGHFLKTDGNGNLSFSATATIPGGSTTQLQYNNAGTIAGIPSVTFASGNLSLGAVANVKITGGASGQVLTTDGVGNLSWSTGGGGGGTAAGGVDTQMQYNNAGILAGMSTLTFNNTSNVITMSGNLDLTGTPLLYKGKEKLYPSSTGAGTINIDVVANGAISWQINTLSGNIAINVRGSESVSFLSQIGNYQSMTIVVVTTVGTTTYYPNNFSIDGTPITPKWVGGISPGTTNINVNSTVAYTYTINRLTLNNYTVLASFTGYV